MRSVLENLMGIKGSEFRAARPVDPFRGHTELPPTFFSTEAIDDLIASGTIRHPMITMARDGRRLRPHMYSWNGDSSIPGHEFRVRPSLVAHQFAQGSSVIVESLHLIDEEIARICEGLAQDVGTYVTACAFLAPASSQGFAHHFDVHDAFVLQVEGSKRWELFEPPLNQPLEEHYFEGIDAYPGLRQRIAGAPALEFTMHPGDTLFLPRGWVHNVYATDEQSLHLNFAMTAKSRRWVLEKVVDSLISSEWARQEVPAPRLGDKFSDTELVNIGDTFAQWIRDNAGELSEVVGLAFAEGIQERNGKPLERAASLPILMSDSVVFDERMILGSRPNPAGTELVLIDGEGVVIPSGLDDAVMAAVESGKPLKVSELASISDDSQATAVCADLVLLGVASVARA